LANRQTREKGKRGKKRKRGVEENGLQSTKDMDLRGKRPEGLRWNSPSKNCRLWIVDSKLHQGTGD